MKSNLFEKSTFKIAIPVLVLTTSISSYALVHKNLLPETQTVLIDEPIHEVENTIDLLQIRTLDSIEGVSNLFYYNGENEIVIGMNKDRQKLLEMDKQENEDEFEYYRKIDGGIYKVDISSMEIVAVKSGDDQIQSFDAELGAGYSPDGKYIDIYENDRQYIYNVKNGQKIEYSKDDIFGNWTENSNGIIKYGIVEKEDTYERKFFFYDNKGNLVNDIAISDEIDWVDEFTGFLSKNGKEVFFAGRVRNNSELKTGIYKLNMETGKLEDVLSLNHSRQATIKNSGTDLVEHKGEYLEVSLQSRIIDFDIMNDGKIIFVGYVDSQNGLFIFNPKTNKLAMLIESDGVVNYKIAPDESKIVYTIDKLQYSDSDAKEDRYNEVEKYYTEVLKNDTNVYVANISENRLNNITYIKKDALAVLFKWSNDSKKLVYYLPQKSQIEKVIFK